LPHLAGGGVMRKSGSCRAMQLLAGENILHELAWVNSDPNWNLSCGQKEPNATNKPVTWWDHILALACKRQQTRPRKAEKIKEKNPPTVSTPSCLARGAAHSPQSPEYQMPISGLDVKGRTPEFLPSRMKFCCCYICFFFFLYY
jgi:hypothetical protein